MSSNDENQKSENDSNESNDNNENNDEDKSSSKASASSGGHTVTGPEKFAEIGGSGGVPVQNKTGVEALANH